MDPFVLLVLLFLCEAASAEDPEVKSVNPGDDVILTCRPADHNIRAVEWTRTDLKSEHVLLSIDGHFISRNQHPFFHDRVQLVDRDLKDRDVSLILKNVKSSDEGTYECRVKVGDSTQQKIEETEPIRRVRLQVTEVISLRPGDDVILPCRSADPNIIVVEWTRTDLKSEYVFFYSDGQPDPENQHPFLQGRVQLVDRDLKDGDASLILKNMESSDEGTYECRVKVDGSTRKKRSIFDDQPIRRIRLQVTEVISVNPGDDAILTCRSADPNIRAVKWTRTDLKPEHVVLSIDGHLEPENQHPFFQGRVQLVDLKDGDASLTLKNMKSSDEGTYECRVKVGGSRRQKRSIIDDQPIGRIRLQVPGSDHGAMMDGGHTGVVNGILGFLIFVLAIAIAVFGFLEIRTRNQKLKKKSEATAADVADKLA